MTDVFLISGFLCKQESSFIVIPTQLEGYINTSVIPVPASASTGSTGI